MVQWVTDMWRIRFLIGSDRYDNCVTGIHMSQRQQVSTRMHCYGFEWLTAIFSMLSMKQKKKTNWNAWAGPSIKPGQKNKLKSGGTRDTRLKTRTSGHPTLGCTTGSAAKTTFFPTGDTRALAVPSKAQCAICAIYLCYCGYFSSILWYWGFWGLEVMAGG